MAAKINAGDAIRRDLWFISPQEITIGTNSRREQFSEEKVERFVVSFGQHGQQQPVQVRKIHEGKVQLVFGFHRHEAMRRYNERNPDKPMKLKCVLVECNEEEAFVASIVENVERAERTPIDDAHAQRELRERYGWDDKRVAELYGTSHSYVSLHKKLLTLPRETQDLVHARELSINAALALADIPASRQTEVLQQSQQETTTKKRRQPEPVKVDDATPADAADPDTHSNGTSNGTATKQAKEPKTKRLSRVVIEKVRESKIEHGKRQPRSVVEIRDFFDGLESRNPRITTMVSLILQFVAGEITDTRMTEMLEQTM